MADAKISALTAKGATLENNDRIPIADFNGTSYDTKYVTGANIVAAVPQCLVITVGDETTAITAGTAKYTFRCPFDFVLTKVKASLNVAPTTSGTFQVDVNSGGSSIFSTPITIDLTEKTTETAATPNVISTPSLSNDVEITIDVDSISGGATEAGLKVYLIGYAEI